MEQIAPVLLFTVGFLAAVLAGTALRWRRGDKGLRDIVSETGVVRLDRLVSGVSSSEQSNEESGPPASSSVGLSAPEARTSNGGGSSLHAMKRSMKGKSSQDATPDASSDGRRA